MGMIMYVRRITDDHIDRLRQGSDDDVARFVFAAAEDGEEDKADLDKAWHGIHYLLTGSDSEGTAPLDFLVAGGEALGEDPGHGRGPPRAFDSEEVTAIWSAIRAIDDDALLARYDGPAMHDLEIYPPVWPLQSGSLDESDYLLHHYALLRSVVSRAAAESEGLLVALV